MQDAEKRERTTAAAVVPSGNESARASRNYNSTGTVCSPYDSCSYFIDYRGARASENLYVISRGRLSYRTDHEV